MLYLVKKNKIYYLRFRIPKDIQHLFPVSEIKRSLKSSSYGQASSTAKLFVAEAEKVFTMIRSNILTYPQICKIIDKLLAKNLARYDEDATNVYKKKEFDEIYDYSIDRCNSKIKENKEYLVKKKCVEARQVEAQNILEKNGIEINKESTVFRQLCEELTRYKITFYEVIKSRINGEEHPYEQELKRKKKTSTIKEVMEGYYDGHINLIKNRSLKKLPEKFNKIIECFEYETSDKEILLSDIDYALTKKVAERLAKYPMYRNLRYFGKTLDEIYALNNFKYPSYTTASEEINLLASIYTFAIKNYDGLDRNYAEGLAKVVLGNSTVKESEFRDVFSPEDIIEILDGLKKIKARCFHTSPHLYLIPLIALYQGMRVNEICQLFIEDIKKVDGIWCIDNNEDKAGKSLKNTNSKRINPIHNDLVEIGLISFVEAQKKRNYSRLWEGVKQHSCEYYEKQGNWSHYFDKWFNGTFKKNLNLSNPAKKSFHSFRHTFLNWFKQNVNLNEHGTAITALSGHLDKDEAKYIGYESDSIAFVRYGKELNVKKQYETLKLLNYGIDINTLKIDV